MSQPTKGCITGTANCHRDHYMLPSHLPDGVCQMLAHQVMTHYEAGDLEQADTLVQFLTQAVAERHEAHCSVYVQLLVARVLHAKDHTQDALERSSEIIRMIDEKNLHDTYQEEYLDALWESALCLYDGGDQAGFMLAAERFTRMESNSCPCYFQIRAHLLQGLSALMQGHPLQALTHLQSIAPYRFVSLFYFVTSLLLSAELAMLQQQTNTALEYIEQASDLMSSDHWGALHAWRERIPATIALADQFSFKWPVNPAPVAYLGKVAQGSQPHVTIEIRAFGEG